jgi:hypothetical protein
MPKKNAKRGTASAKVKISKAAFVRSLPTSMSAKEVVAKAKALGITLTDAYVYNVRATSKAGKAKSSRRVSTGSRSRKGRTITVRLSGARAAEDLLRAVAAELGLARAIAVLEADHARIRKLLGT